MDPKTVIKLLDLILMGLERSSAIDAKFREGKKFIASLNGRDPTVEEWDTLRNRLGVAEATIETRAEEARKALGQ
jgi:hypothetical protein